MYHLRARHYSPGLARYLARDPIGYAGGSNLYAYCGGDPINYVDPHGTDAEYTSKAKFETNTKGDLFIDIKTNAKDIPLIPEHVAHPGIYLQAFVQARVPNTDVWEPIFTQTKDTGYIGIGEINTTKFVIPGSKMFASNGDRFYAEIRVTLSQITKVDSLNPEPQINPFVNLKLGLCKGFRFIQFDDLEPPQPPSRH